MSDEWPMPAGPFTGGCQCGAVRFRAEALHDNPHVCYCRMCQKATGNMFASLVGVLHENLTWTRGEPSRFRSSEHVDRGFCSNCGTPLFYQYLPGGRVGMTIGSFDEPHRIELRWQMGMEGKHPSLLHLNEVEALGTTETAEDEEQLIAIRQTNGQHPDHDTTDWTPRPSTV
ncbi:MAG: GFA family protein [Devosia sp.]